MTHPATGSESLPHRSAEAALAAVCLIWGSTFVLVKNALADISPALFLALRFSIAAAVLAAIYFVRRQPLRPQWRAGVVTGLFLYAGYLLQTLGLQFTTPAKSGFLTGLYIVLVPLLSAAVYRRAPGFSESLGVALAIVGMGLMTLTSVAFDIARGDLLTIACAFAFAVHIILLGHYAKQMSTEWLTLLQIGTCAVVSLVACGLLEPAMVRWTPSVVVALAVTAVLATAMAFYLQTWGQRHTTATRAALIFSLEPVFAWLTSYLFEHEVFTMQSAAGAACILAGILIVELKPLDRQMATSG